MTPAAVTDATRQRAIEAAAACFAENGIARVSLEEVAARAGMHRTTLHRHFPGGRDELVLAVLEHETDAVTRQIIDHISQARSAREAIVETVVAAVREGRRNRTAAALLGEPTSRVALFSPAATQFRTTALETWDAISAQVAANGEHVVDVDPERAIDHVFRVVVSLISDPGTIVTDDDVRRYVEDFVVPALVVT